MLAVVVSAGEPGIGQPNEGRRTSPPFVINRLDSSAVRRLEEAVVQSTQIGAVNSWLRNQPACVYRKPHPYLIG